MAQSTCAKCGSTSFELQEQVPQTSAFKLLFVQCARCGTVVGVLDYENIGEMLRQQNTVLQKIADTLGTSTR